MISELRNPLLTLLLLSCTAHSYATTCEGSQPTPTSLLEYGTGWGIDERNTRFQPNSQITSENAGRLTLKWVYALGGQAPRSHPLITQDTIYIGSDGVGVIALDRESGCERWRFAHNGPIGSAIVPGRIEARPILIFNDRTSGVFAIDATDGEFIWHASIDDEPIPWYSGTPLVAGQSVYLPISSLEVGLAANPLYGCCTTSGGMAALDIATGQKRWYLPTIAEPAEKTGSHYLLVSRYGPSGAAVWGTPSIDADSNLLFFGTGQNYSHPTTDSSDAIFAVHADSGEIAWMRQFTANDAYNASCNAISLNHPNCPKPLGPDVDFGAATMILRNSQGKLHLIAGQKSADVHALDPQSGDLLWSEKLGRGGIIGGVHWGMAANEALGLLFVPISDKGLDEYPSPGVAQPGLYALDIETGERRWHYKRQDRCADKGCIYGLSSAIIATNDVVVTGSIDGYLEVVHAATGRLLWSHDAWQEYQTVNEMPASGGGFDAHGPMVADDILVVSAGYGYVGDQRPGNALLVFQVEGENEP